MPSADLNTGSFSVLGSGQSASGRNLRELVRQRSLPSADDLQRPRRGGLCARHPAARLPAAGEAAVNYHMSEFFIRKQHRRVGIGPRCRHTDLRPFRGRLGNRRISCAIPGSVAFWRRVVSAIAAQAATRSASRNGEVRQRFTSQSCAATSKREHSRSSRAALSPEAISRRSSSLQRSLPMARAAMTVESAN